MTTQAVADSFLSSYEQPMEDKETKDKHDMPDIKKMLWAGLFSGVFALGWAMTASRLSICPCVRFTVLAVSTGGSICFFSVGICLMRKKDGEDDFKELEGHIDVSTPVNQPSAMLPSKEEVRRKFEETSFVWFLKLPYSHKAIEKGYLSFKDAKSREKFLDWFSSASLEEVVDNYHEMMAEALSEPERSSFLCLRKELIKLRDDNEKQQTLLESDDEVNAIRAKYIERKLALLKEGKFVCGTAMREEDEASRAEQAKVRQMKQKQKNTLESNFEKDCRSLEGKWEKLRRTFRDTYIQMLRRA